MSIEVHPLTQNPTAAWKELSKTQKVVKINVPPPKNDVPENMVSIFYDLSSILQKTDPN